MIDELICREPLFNQFIYCSTTKHLQESLSYPIPLYTALPKMSVHECHYSVSHSRWLPASKGLNPAMAKVHSNRMPQSRGPSQGTRCSFILAPPGPYIQVSPHAQGLVIVI